MPLSPEDKQEILEILTEANKGLKEEFVTQINQSQEQLKTEFTNQIGGVMGRTKKEIQNAVSGVKTDINTELTQSLKDLLPQGNQNSGEESNNNNTTGQNNDRQQETGELTQLAQQIKNQADQMRTLQEKYQEAEKARQASEQQAQKSRLEAGFISKIGDKVVDPRTFLKVLIDSGKIFEEEGQLVTRTGNLTVNGTPETVEASTVVDQFLTKDYSYFAKPRPGNGGGSQISGDTRQQQQAKNKYFRDDNPNKAQDILAALKAGKQDEVYQELDKTINSPG